MLKEIIIFFLIVGGGFMAADSDYPFLGIICMLILVQENRLMKSVVKLKYFILEIGCDTGKLIYTMASQISDSNFERIDFSETMISIAQ